MSSAYPPATVGKPFTRDRELEVGGVSCLVESERTARKRGQAWRVDRLSTANSLRLPRGRLQSG
jgi:hypothetical protein